LTNHRHRRVAGRKISTTIFRFDGDDLAARRFRFPPALNSGSACLGDTPRPLGSALMAGCGGKGVVVLRRTS
jgi:hypothetical protein